MKRNSNVVTFGGMPVTLMGKIAKIGQTAKNFTTVGTDLKNVNLSDYSNKIKIISSVPSIDTEVCAMQTRRFNEEATKFYDAVVLTVSCDLPFALKRFCAAEGIDKVITVSDHKSTDFGLKYGFLIEEFRLLARGIVIIDRKDIIQYIELVKDVTLHPDYNKALEMVRNLHLSK